jgi:CubicO group peptidase (beta-lactamase class C family)
MHRSVKLVLVGVLAVAAALAGARPGWTTDPDEQVSSDIAERIARIENGLFNPFALKGQHANNLAERMEHYNVPGVSIAFFEHGEITWARGYGYADVAQKTVVTPETRFQAASISKPVTALAALHVVEEGKLALDEDVNATLKSWKVPENEFTRKEKVTLRRLLTHTAGLTVHGFPGYASNENVPSIVQVLDGERPANTAAVRIDTEPGKTSRYSGGGFTVIQLMLTDVTGKSFPELMSELVLRPAGMNWSTYYQPLPKEMADSEATPYQTSGEAVKGGPHTYPEMAAAGLWTTPSDLGRLALEVEREYDGVSRKILTPTMARQYLTVQKGDFALGIEVKGSGNSLEFTHAGGNAGYRCVLVDFPERHQGVAIMTNSDNGAQITSALLRSVAREYGWPDYHVIDVTGFVALLFLMLVMFTAYRRLRLSQQRVVA